MANTRTDEQRTGEQDRPRPLSAVGRALRALGPGFLLAALGVLVAVPLAIALTPSQGTTVAGQHLAVRATTPSTGWLSGWSGPASLKQIGQTVVPLAPVQVRGPLRPQLQLGPLVRQQDVDELLDPRHGSAARHQALTSVVHAFRDWYLLASVLVLFLALAIIALACCGWIGLSMRRASRHHSSPTVAEVWHRLARRIRIAVATALALTLVAWLAAGALAALDTVSGLRTVSSPRDLVGAAPLHLRAKGAALTGYTGAVIGDSRAARLGGDLVPDPTADDRSCKRSADSLAAQLTTLSPTDRVANLACSGATISEGLLGPQQRGKRTVPPQVSRLLTSSDLRFVAVMVGPNDLDWTDFLKYCYAFSRCDDRVSGGQFGYRLAAFDRSYGDLLAALASLPGHPRIVVVGSYDVFGPDAHCTDTRGPDGVPGLDAKNLALISERNRQLNDVLARGAGAYHDDFVVPHLRELCQPVDPQVGADIQGLSDAHPFHPTGVGMVRLAAPVFAALQAPRPSEQAE